jgi:hypothetical protein
MVYDKRIVKFYEKVDKFIFIQLDFAMGLSLYDAVLGQHKEVINYLKELSFEDEKLEAGRVEQVKSFEGTSDRLFCQELMSIPEDESLVFDYLEKARDSIDSAHYYAILSKYKDFHYVDKGFSIGVMSDEWLESNDQSLAQKIDPFILKKALFSLTSFDEGSCSYVFAEAPREKGFFMGSFFLEKKYFIGHPKVETLFDLSLLAHEIGHTTTFKERNLEKAFTEAHENESFDFEMDSYFYEKVLFDNIDIIFKELGINNMGANLKDKLEMMRAVKHNRHVLRLKLVSSFFSGDSLGMLNEIYKDFLDKIKVSRQERGFMSSVKIAQLHNPLNSIPYLKAYERHFSS